MLRLLQFILLVSASLHISTKNSTKAFRIVKLMKGMNEIILWMHSSLASATHMPMKLFVRDTPSEENLSWVSLTIRRNKAIVELEGQQRLW